MIAPASITATILFTSDIHGHLYPTDYRGPGDKPVGLIKLAAHIERERQQDPALLLIDGGDLIQGTPLMYHYAKFDRSGRHPAARALNALRYDLVVPGNHEFNYGRALLDQAIADSDCPWVSANIVQAADGQPTFGQPYRIFTLPADIRIAVLGVTTSFIPNWEEPSHIEGLAFEDALDATARWVSYIREHEKPDAVIVCYHGGFERDPETGAPTEPLTGENQGYAICERLSGAVDVLLTGHQHRLLAGSIHGVAIGQPGSAGEALCRVELKFEPSTDGGWSLCSREVQLLSASEAAATDETLLSLFAEDERKTQEWLNQPIGRTEGDLSIPDPFKARQGDNAFTEFVNRVQLAVTGADISCAAIFTNEARGLGERITMRDIVSNYIYPNTLKVLRLSGQDIRAALEQNACYFERTEAGELQVAPAYLAPKPQHFNYDMWEGIEYVLDISKPVGQRVVKLERDGVPLNPDASFDVVMNSYRAGGGGNFDMLKGKPVVREIPTDMTEVLADYIGRHGVIRAECNGNWKVIY